MERKFSTLSIFVMLFCMLSCFSCKKETGTSISGAEGKFENSAIEKVLTLEETDCKKILDDVRKLKLGIKLDFNSYKHVDEFNDPITDSYYDVCRKKAIETFGKNPNIPLTFSANYEELHKLLKDAHAAGNKVLTLYFTTNQGKLTFVSRISNHTEGKASGNDRFQNIFENNWSSREMDSVPTMDAAMKKEFQNLNYVPEYIIYDVSKALVYFDFMNKYESCVSKSFEKLNFNICLKDEGNNVLKPFLATIPVDDKGNVATGFVNYDYGNIYP